MSKKKVAKRASKPPAPAVAPAPGAGPSFQFLGIVTRELIYRELPIEGVTVADLVASGALQEQALGLQTSIGFSPPNLAEVSMLATLTPTSEAKPFELSVKISGLFAKSPGMSNRRAAEALSDLAGRMMFPFVREALMTMTSKTVFGALPIQPVLLQPLFSSTDLAQIVD